MERFDLGNGYSYDRFGWKDPVFNPPFPMYAGIILACPHGNVGAVHFDIPNHPPFREGWKVISWEPLTLAPSIQFMKPNCCHGYIRQGKWVSA